MKRSRAIAVFVMLVLLLGGYSAWCGRAFYTKPPLVFQPDASEAEVEAASRWHEKTDQLSPMPFRFEQYCYYLKNPWKPVHYPVNVSSGLISQGRASGLGEQIQGQMTISHQRRYWRFVRSFGGTDYRFFSFHEY